MEETQIIPIVTAKEVIGVSNRLGDKKNTPGVDGIPNKALKAAIKTQPYMFASLYNSYMIKGVLPDRWKKQTLVLLPKGNNRLVDPSSFRSLCMLDTAGKVLELIICNRLEVALKDK